MAKVLVRQVNVYDSDKVSEDTGLRCEDVTLTKQEFAEEADINTLVKRFGLMGTMPPNHRVAMYSDFEGDFSYHEAMNKVRDADFAFNAMPPEVRARFGNSPQALMDFCADAANAPEMKRLGLLAPEAAKAVPLAVRVIPEPSNANPDPKSSE